MSFNVATLVAVTVLGLAACQQQPMPRAETGNRKPAAEQRANDHSSDMAAVIELFASPNGRDWNAYESLGGIEWIDPALKQDVPGRYSRSAKMLLLGFTEADIPNGRPGTQYATTKRNEGESILSLSGTQGGVESISIQKPLYSDDYLSILKHQLDADAAIALIADSCAANEYEDGAATGAFYAIRLGDQNEVYVRAAQEDGGKYTAGFTTFELSRTRPSPAIAAAGCRTPF